MKSCDDICSKRPHAVTNSSRSARLPRKSPRSPVHCVNAKNLISSRYRNARPFDALLRLETSLTARRAALAAACEELSAVDAEIKRDAPDERLIPNLDAIDALVNPAAQARKGVDDLGRNRLPEMRDAAAARIAEALLRTWPGAAVDDLRTRSPQIIAAMQHLRSVHRRWQTVARDAEEGGAQSPSDR